MGRRLIIPNPSCVHPAPMMRTGALGEILVCSQDHFTVGPARRGLMQMALPRTPSPGTPPDSPIALTG